MTKVNVNIKIGNKIITKRSLETYIDEKLNKIIYCKHKDQICLNLEHAVSTLQELKTHQTQSKQMLHTNLNCKNKSSNAVFFLGLDMFKC